MSAQMNTEPTIAELEETLKSLLSERDEIKAFLAQVPSKEKRLNEMGRGWCSMGLIEATKRAIRDAAFPIFIASGNGWERNQRIVSMDEKWIGIRGDLDEDHKTVFYKTETGQKKGTRSEWSKIDAAKAVEIWKTAHTNSK